MMPSSEFLLQILIPCCKPHGSVGGEKRCTYIATEGETIPGYVAATMESVKVNILEEVKATIYHAPCCNSIYTFKLVCRETTHDSPRDQYWMVGTVVLTMIILFVQHSGMTIVCMYFWMCRACCSLHSVCAIPARRRRNKWRRRRKRGKRSRSGGCVRIGQEGW